MDGLFRSFSLSLLGSRGCILLIISYFCVCVCVLPDIAYRQRGLAVPALRGVVEPEMAGFPLLATLFWPASLVANSS